MLYLERWYKPCHLQVMFNGPSIKKVDKYTIYISTLGKNIKKQIKNLHVLMVPWYIKVQMMSFKNI